MTDQQQTLSEMPLWAVVIMSIVAGFAGEMWRADKAGLSGWNMVHRIVLRAGASMIFGLSTMLLVWVAGAHVLAAAAVGFVVATMGADVASGLYERWAAKRLDVCDSQARDKSTDT
ncbi:phage holin family protein [Pseudomonas sp. NPDC086581]|uniref:phage holin family protein n=1 Tax=Pseudomonas sp. NPDC086581 TaxID=3364432 RepID=UPI0038001FB7